MKSFSIYRPCNVSFLNVSVASQSWNPLFWKIFGRFYIKWEIFWKNTIEIIQKSPILFKIFVLSPVKIPVMTQCSFWHNIEWLFSYSRIGAKKKIFTVYHMNLQPISVLQCFSKQSVDQHSTRNSCHMMRVQTEPLSESVWDQLASETSVPPSLPSETWAFYCIPIWIYRVGRACLVEFLPAVLVIWRLANVH